MENLRRAILVNVTSGKDANKVLEELALLANTADYYVAGSLTQHKERPDKVTFMGKGKLEELKAMIEELNADIVIFDNDVNGSQFNNLENFLEVDVIDRATLILEIFARHATSNEGKIQVELARKKHNMPRVLGKFANLSRQGGGGGGGGGARRGAGEQKLELDKRTIKEEIRDLEQKIEKLTQERRLRRSKRKRSNIKIVAIVGYTNAGKSTLMNTITKAGVLEEDKLFATLDPVSRHLWLDTNKELLLVDTVGFISRLPHEFISAFKSTLEETQYADLILHIVDSASPDMQAQYDVVNEVLESIGAKDTPTIVVYNKADKQGFHLISETSNYITISAKTGAGIESLKNKISEMLFGNDTEKNNEFTTEE